MCAIAFSKAVRNLMCGIIWGLVDISMSRARFRGHSSSQTWNGCQVEGKDSGPEAKANRVTTPEVVTTGRLIGV